MKRVEGAKAFGLEDIALAIVQEYLLDLHVGVRHVELRRQAHEV